MVQLIAIIVKEITQRHKYRWHVTTEKYIIMYNNCVKCTKYKV